MSKDLNEKPNSPANLQGAHLGSQEMTALWGLRIIVHLNLYNKFIDSIGGFYNEEVLQAIGLHDYYKAELNTETNRSAGLKIISDRLKALESSKLTTKKDAFSRNIAILQKSLSLTECEVEILRFAVVSVSAGGFGYLVDSMGEMSDEQMKKTLSIILAMPIGEIEQALRADSTLLSSGLLRVEHGAYLLILRAKLDVPQGIKAALSQEHEDTAGVLQCFFRKSTQVKLGISDYPHVSDDISLLQNYLKSAINKGSRGVNILLYGAPGTGKTELVRTLVSSCDFRLYEITMQDSNGEPIAGKDRLSTLQLAQKLLDRENECAIMFDEIEDVFPPMSNMFFRSVGTTEPKKAWVNNLLEDNAVPAFWVSNEVQQIEPSFLRRFDYCLKLGPPPPVVRRRILSKYLTDLPVSDSWLARWADHDMLTPAHIERAAKVVTHLGAEATKEVEENLERILGNSLEVMGIPRKSTTQKGNTTTQYNLDFLNPSVDLQQVINGLKRRPQARICLYGAPGTGKTAYAHFVADNIGKRLLIRRASDLLSKWVGDSEQNIAAMFHEAAREDRVLLLDEADSFLQDRSGSHQSWEVTQVNELLVQMEDFEGVFIASTNLMETLDAASIRRFDLKIKFDYMQPDQSWNLFKQILQENDSKIPANTSTIKNRLIQLQTLTPGDYATVVRQSLCLGQTLDAKRLLDALEEECEAKPGHEKPIGFLTH